MFQRHKYVVRRRDDISTYFRRRFNVVCRLGECNILKKVLANGDITNAYEEDESDENVDDDGHSSSSEEESDMELIDLPPRSGGQAFISKIGYRSSVIGRLHTSDDNDLEHVMNTENSLETCPFATFRPTPTFYNLYKLFFCIV